MNEETSLLFKSQFIIVRHGESISNVQSSKLRAEMKNITDHDELAAFKKRYKQEKMSPTIQDALISEKGAQEAINQ